MATSYAAHQNRAEFAAGRIRKGALVCVIAGVLGVASGVALAVVEPAVDADRFSFPLTAEGFTAIQVWFTVHHLGLLAGLLALGWAGVLPDTSLAQRGSQLAVAGMVGLTVTEAVAIAAADDLVDSGAGPVVGALYGVVCLALGMGLVMAGAAIARAQTWAGWRRWVVLVLGVWVFVPMFPALALTPTDGARWAISGWMALFGLLGVALLRPGHRGTVSAD